MLALSSLSRRSIYVGLAWAGFCFITWSLSGILIGVNLHGEIRAAEEATLSAWMADASAAAGHHRSRSRLGGSALVKQ